jgi:hypothetical protein
MLEVMAGNLILVEVASAPSGADLVESLAKRGLIARLHPAGENWDVAVETRGEDLVALLTELITAIETWRGDRPGPDLAVRVVPALPGGRRQS